MAVNFAVARDLIDICRKAQISLFIWGSHGIGKSALVRQFAESQKIGFVDLRLAQLDPVDLRGLPDRTENGTTQFLPPDELPKTGEGILFLDELNRAGADIQSAIFQLVLDRRIGAYQLPEGWQIVAAGNFYGEDYDTVELDPAFRDRFLHTVLSQGRPTFDEWAAYLGSHFSNAHRAISFCAGNLEHLETQGRNELDFKIIPSRRRWEMLVRFEAAFENNRHSPLALHEGLTGLIGHELALSYGKYQATISPLDLIKDGVAEYRELILQLSREQKWSLSWGMISHMKNEMSNSKLTNVAMELLEVLFRGKNADADLGIAFVVELLRLTEDVIGVEGIRMMLLRNPKLIKDMIESNKRRNGPRNLLDALSEHGDLLQCLSEAVQVS